MFAGPSLGFIALSLYWKDNLSENWILTDLLDDKNYV